MNSPWIADVLDRLVGAYVDVVGEDGFFVLGLLALLWMVELVNLPLGHALSRGLGIRPRTAGGLPGVVLSPLLHFSPAHVLSNTPPLFVLGSLVAFQDPGRFASISIAIVLLAGMAEWLVLRGDAVYAGASGLVFGYLGYLVVRGVRGGSPTAFLIAVIVLVYYRYALSGVLPWGVDKGISWEGHFLGAAAGVVTALHVSRTMVL